MHLRNAILVLVVALLSVFMLACSDDDDGDNGNGAAATSPASNGATGSAPSDGGGSTSLTITAENNEFDKDELTAPASTEIDLEMDNQDSGVLHNFSLYTSSDASEAIFTGDLVTGVMTTTYTFETPEPGEYFFRCDVHPDTMTGTFITE